MFRDNLYDDMLPARINVMRPVCLWHVQEADVEIKCIQRLIVFFSASAKHSYRY